MNWEPVEILVKKSRECMEAGNYSACAEIARHILQMDPDNREAAALHRQARIKEDERMQAELTAQSEALWQEAQAHFQAGEYAACLPILNFLHELGPDNRLVHDQLESCLHKLRDMGMDPAKILCSVQRQDEESALFTIADSGHSATQPEEFSGMAADMAGGPEGTTSLDADTIPQSRQPGAKFFFLSIPSITAAWLYSLQDPAMKKRWLIRGGALAAILLSIFILYRLFTSGMRIKSVETSFAMLSVNSNPTGAQVLINGVPRGETNLLIDPIIPGNYVIRIEKSGFAPVIRHLPVNKGENTNLSIQLESTAKSGSDGMDSGQLEREQIRSLFLQGKIAEANQGCERLLTSDPQNEFALQLRQAMRDQLLSKIRSEIQLRQWAEALENLKLSRQISPDDAEMRALWLQLPDNFKKEIIPPAGPNRADDRKIQSLHQQIQAAIDRGRFFPPSQGNAFELLKKLQKINSADPFFSEKQAQLSRTLFNQANAAFQAHRLADAKEQLRKGLILFPRDQQMISLEKNVRQQEVSAPNSGSEQQWLQLAEQAMKAGRYVRPDNDNVLSYCNRILATNSRQLRATQLKSEALAGALAQARAWVERGEFENAISNYQLLIQLSAGEKNFPLSLSEVKNEFSKADFAVYSVIHDHGIRGKCTGKLKVNSYQVSYSPSGKSKDAFVAKFGEIGSVEGGGNIKIQFRDRTYRFTVDTGSRREESRRQTDLLFQTILQNYLAAGKK